MMSLSTKLATSTREFRLLNQYLAIGVLEIKQNQKNNFRENIIRTEGLLLLLSGDRFKKKKEKKQSKKLFSVLMSMIGTRIPNKEVKRDFGAQAINESWMRRDRSSIYCVL